MRRVVDAVHTRAFVFREDDALAVVLAQCTFRDETATRLPQQDNLDAWPYAIRVADLNGDGKPDLAVAVNNSGAPPFYIYNGDGSFTPLAVSTASSMFDLADVNGDGRPDIVSAQPSSSGGSAATPSACNKRQPA